jgi:hypothetical protein
VSRCAGGTVYNMVFCVFFVVAPNGCAKLSQRGNRSAPSAPDTLARRAVCGPEQEQQCPKASLFRRHCPRR